MYTLEGAELSRSNSFMRLDNAIEWTHSSDSLSSLAEETTEDLKIAPVHPLSADEEAEDESNTWNPTTALSILVLLSSFLL
jgi:hypothetical protein